MDRRQEKERRREGEEEGKREERKRGEEEAKAKRFSAHLNGHVSTSSLPRLFINFLFLNLFLSFYVVCACTRHALAPGEMGTTGARVRGEDSTLVR